MLNIDEKFRHNINFNNLDLFKCSDFVFWEQNVIFYSFWVIFCPLDPDPDPGSQNIADPTNPDSNYIPPPPSTKKLNY